MGDKQKVTECDICKKDIIVDEEHYTVNLQLEKVDSNSNLFKGDSLSLYSVCKLCSQDMFLKGLTLSESDAVRLSTDSSF